MAVLVVTNYEGKLLIAEKIKDASKRSIEFRAGVILTAEQHQSMLNGGSASADGRTLRVFE